jgi:hypothetical protein
MPPPYHYEYESQYINVYEKEQTILILPTSLNNKLMAGMSSRFKHNKTPSKEQYRCNLHTGTKGFLSYFLRLL